MLGIRLDRGGLKIRRLAGFEIEEFGIRENVVDITSEEAVILRRLGWNGVQMAEVLGDIWSTPTTVRGHFVRLDEERVCRVKATCGDETITIVLAALFLKPFLEGLDGEFVRISVESTRGAEGIYSKESGAVGCGWPSNSRGGFGLGLFCS